MLSTSRKICPAFLQATGSTLQSIDVIEFVVVRPGNIINTFKSVPYLNPVTVPEYVPATLGELMVAWYYFWDMQAMLTDSQTHSAFTASSA